MPSTEPEYQPLLESDSSSSSGASSTNSSYSRATVMLSASLSNSSKNDDPQKMSRSLLQFIDNPVYSPNEESINKEACKFESEPLIDSTNICKDLPDQVTPTFRSFSNNAYVEARQSYTEPTLSRFSTISPNIMKFASLQKLEHSKNKESRISLSPMTNSSNSKIIYKRNKTNSIISNLSMPFGYPPNIRIKEWYEEKYGRMKSCTRMLSTWWRQFRLLTQKNLLLMWRSKVWTLFELILPILFMLPITILIAKMPEDKIERIGQRWDPFPIYGGHQDMLYNNEAILTNHQWWRREKNVTVGYVIADGPDFPEAEKLMADFGKRYTDMAKSPTTRVQMNMKKFSTERELEKLIREAGTVVLSRNFADLKNKSEIVAGIVIDRFDVHNREFSYRILLYGGSVDLDLFYTETGWKDPFGIASSSGAPFPYPMSYWKSGFLSYQYALDKLFIKLGQEGSTNTNDDEHVRLPEMEFQRIAENPMQAERSTFVLKFLPGLFGACVFLAILHCAREIASEKQEVKGFLSVMGLSATMFYVTHLLFAWIKVALIIIVVGYPIYSILEYVGSIYLFVLPLYGLSAVCVGALIASIFKTPNSTLKVIVVVWILLVGILIKAPDPSHRFYSFLFALNCNGAFNYAMDAMVSYVNRKRYLNWGNMFEEGDTTFCLGHAVIMLIVDVIWMFLLTMGIDYYFTHDIIRWNWRSGPHRGGSLAQEGTNETDAGLTMADIRVKELRKIYSTGELAVDDLSFEAYRGQVTTLLGHNGAGKSTTFSIICGILPPTEGSVEICEMDVRNNLSECRRNIGYCPQTNALFPKLTVSDHTWLIHGLSDSDTDYRTESDELLNELKLMDKTNTLSMNLSGGMKRKLCVAMALIGGNRVILLDEPTAGMDPGARRDVERILEKAKRDKTVLLTTHYMDEAELLGDRVVIMSKGRVVCSGTPQFLKNQFGTGYLLTVVVQEKSNHLTVGNVDNESDRLLKITRQYVKNAVIGKIHGRQIEIILPKEEQERFADLFERLEKEKSLPGSSISSFGLSLNTLEQVFLKVGEMADQADGSYRSPINTQSSSGSSPESSTLIQNQLSELSSSSDADRRRKGGALILRQILAILQKRAIYSMRNWAQLITQVAVPILIFLLVGYLSKLDIQIGYQDIGERQLTLDDFGPTKVYLQTDGTSPSKEYREFVNVGSNQMIDVQPTANLTGIQWNQEPVYPAAGIGAVIMKDKMQVLFHGRHEHTAPTSMNVLSNAYLAAQGKGRIITGLRAFIIKSEDEMSEEDLAVMQTAADMTKSTVINYLLGPVSMLALALLTSTIIMFLVEERMCKFAHQQSLTGISPFVFWGSSFLYDALFYVLACSLFLSIFLIFGWFDDDGKLRIVVLLWTLYFWSSVPLVYVISFLFSSASKANILLIIWQLLASLVGIILVTIAQANLSPVLLETIRTLLLMILPSFALANGMAMIPLSDVKDIWKWDNIGKNVICMSVFGLFSSALFLLFSYKPFRHSFLRLMDYHNWGTNNNVGSDEEDGIDTDGDVIRERKYVEEAEKGSLILRIMNLVKMFGSVRAVNRLSLGVEPEECVGLLGVNGAGKTTTFDVLTGQSYATSGRAEIDDIDVSQHIPIGYCPQFDAMMIDLTGRENLKILAVMHGFPQPDIRVKAVLKAVGMQEHADKCVRFYSGGQKRKLSVGIAILSATKLIILDEPTAGIDPKARRDIWGVLTTTRQNDKSAILLTSHSMDECEALCSKIAVLARGKMIAVGSSQALKSKFGNSYTLTMTVDSKDEKGFVMQKVLEEFPDAALKTHHESQSLNLKWVIPKHIDDHWSSMFRRVQIMVRDLPVKDKDFCMAQSSLEETFMTLAGGSSERISRSSSRVN